MTYASIISDLKNKKYVPIYVLHGEESYFIDQISHYIEKNVLNESEQAFNQMVLYGKEIAVVQVIDAARQFPMMASHRVIVVKEAQGLSKIDQLEGYLKNPSPQTILVICYKHKKADGRSKWLKAAKTKGVVFESKKLYDNQVAPWIIQNVSEKGKVISPSAANIMAEFLGADLSKISNEIDKLIVNLKDKKTITDEIVHEQVGITKDYNVFELQKAISLKDTEKAFRIVNYFKQNPKSGPLVMVLGSLYNYFTKVYTVAYHVKKKSDKELASMVGVSPYFLGEYKQAAKNYSLQKMVMIFSELKNTDLKSKGVGARNVESIELLRELMIKIFY